MMWHIIMLPCDMEKRLIRCMWHGLNLAYVPCPTIAQVPCGMSYKIATWHYLSLAQLPYGMSQTQHMCHVAWHSLTSVTCGMSQAQPRCRMAWPRPYIYAMWHVLSQPNLGATWHVLTQLKCHVAWIRPSICAMWHGLSLTYVPCDISYVVFKCHGMAQTQPICHMSWPKTSI